MDNEQLKDIIIDHADFAPIESLQAEKDIIEAFESAQGSNPVSPLLTPSQLSSDEPLTDEKKKLAAALAAAQELGIIENQEQQSAVQLASTADTLVEQLRQDYQVGTGSLSEEEAHENVLDRSAAQFTGNVDKVLDNLVDKVGIGTSTAFHIWAEKALDCIETNFPETSFLRPAAEQLVDVIDEKVVSLIVVGAKKVAEKVKTAVSAATEKAKTYASKVADYIKSFF